MDEYVQITETKEALQDALKSGKLLTTVNQIYRDEIKSDSKTLSQALSELHNESAIDLNKQFGSLSRNDEQLSFFNLLHVYESSLPLINSHASGAVKCVGNLLQQAGRDLAVGVIYSAFGEFCKKDIQRSKEALEAILREPDKFSSLISEAIAASSEHELEWSLGQVRNLVTHTDASIKWQAYIATGRMKLSTNHEIELALSILENTYDSENNDLVKGSILRAAISLGKKNNILWNRISNIIRNILDSPEPNLLYEASRIAAYDSSGLPTEVKSQLLKSLESTSADSKGVIDNIDNLLVNLLKEDCNLQAEELLESLLCRQKDLKITAFDYFSHELLNKQNKQLCRFVTKWLLSGNYRLCNAVQDLLHDVSTEEVELTADRDLLEGSSINIQFIARKAVGWLFMRPIGAASLIISLVDMLPSDEASELEELLFYPLLLSYTGELKKYFERLEQEERLVIGRLAKKLLLRLDEYFDKQKTAFEIRELKSPQENSDLYWNRFQRMMQQAKDDAPKGIFEQLCTVNHLLYGNSSIYYVHNGDGKTHRTESKMQKISHSTEMPRMHIIDPEGMEFMLRVYRVERFKNETDS